jgi:hypothetical protein
MKNRTRRVLRNGAMISVLLCIAVLGMSALVNRNLPSHSKVADRLSPLDKARLAEVFHLRQTLGDTVWPGWGQRDIPIIVYNEEYAFLVGYPNPPTGWIKMPQRATRGGPWQLLPDDLFENQPYYRQRLPDPDITPENFTVLVGDRWVVSMQTREYAEIAFYAGFRKQLPSWLRGVFPYPLAWKLLMGETDTYIVALEHEAFHSFQGIMVPSRLEEAEIVNRVGSQYRWDDPALTDDWHGEMVRLVQAARARSDGEAIELARQFLAARKKRRSAHGLNSDLVNYELQREWLEGLAKYAEVSIGRVAATTPGYEPVSSLAADPGFKRYVNRERYLSQQLDETLRTAGREGEVRFYYSGMAQALLLDRLLPGWKQLIFKQGVALEGLLQELAQKPSP